MKRGLMISLSLFCILALSIPSAFAVNTKRPWHSLQQVSKTLYDHKNVDNNTNGIIDFAENLSCEGVGVSYLVSGSAEDAIFAIKGDTGKSSGIYLYDGNALSWKLGKDLNNDLFIEEEGMGKRFVIKDLTGLVGIGTDAPTQVLEVNGNIALSGTIFTVGGNPRGMNAVDLQNERTSPNAVAAGDYSAILSGRNNSAGGDSIVLGGLDNNANFSSLVGIGIRNRIQKSLYSAIIGGEKNLIYESPSISRFNIILLGANNKINGTFNLIGSGQGNLVSGHYSVILGGSENEAIGKYSAIGGGYNNTANYSTVSGGFDNVANGTNSSVIGGANNWANGQASVAAGGSFNKALGDYSFVGGRHMVADKDADNSFVWGVSNSDVTVSSPNVAVFWNTNLGVRKTNPSEAIDVNGNIRASGTICDSVGCIGGGGGGGISALFLDGDNAAPQTLNDGNTIKIVGGQGITTSSGATDSVTVNVNTGSGLVVSGDNVQIRNDCAANQILRWDGTTWNCVTPGFSIAGSSAGSVTQTINNGDTVTIAAGTGITATAGAVDTVTVAVDTGTIQRRVVGGCPVGSTIIAVGGLGTVVCQDIAEFGGIYYECCGLGQPGYSCFAPNPLTGGCICPLGFSISQTSLMSPFCPVACGRRADVTYCWR